MSCICHPAAQVPTTPLSVRVQDVKVSDYYDSRVLGGGRGSKDFIAQVFDIDYGPRGCSVTLHLMGQRAVTFEAGKTVNVWRSSALTDARPIDLRTDRPVRTLNEVQSLGKDGLATTFPAGSIWEVGPFTQDVDPMVVEITGDPFTSGMNYSVAPDATEARGKACWFVPTKTLYDPFGGTRPRNTGKQGQPPHVLGQLTPRMAWVAGLAEDQACGADLRVEKLTLRVRNLEEELAAAWRAHQADLRKLGESNAKLVAVKAALAAI